MITHDEAYVKLSKLYDKSSEFNNMMNEIILKIMVITIPIATIIITSIALIAHQNFLNVLLPGVILSAAIISIITSIVYYRLEKKFMQPDLNYEIYQAERFLDNYAEYAALHKAKEILKIEDENSINIHYSGGSGKITFWDAIYYKDGMPEKITLMYDNSAKIAAIAETR